MVPDSAGGAYFASSIGGTSSGNDTYVLHRFTGEGTLAEGWSASGALVCQAPEVRQSLVMCNDDLGGALLAWTDYRDRWNGYASDLYVMRILPDGSRAPGWPANGLRMTNMPSFDEARDIAPDGQGGAYVCYDVITSYDWYTFVQHVTATGEVAEGWPANGRSVTDTPSGQDDAASIISDGAGGCIVVWEGEGGIRARRFMADGPVATAISLASATVEDGVVRLAWYGHDAAHLEAMVERREPSSDWRVVAIVRADGAGRFEHEDRGATPGVRYAYRLRWREADGERTTSDSWVEVPAALRLALEGLRPNPAATEEVRVAFVLPTGSPARLDVLDVTGRQRLSRDLAGFGPGRHSVRLGNAAPLEPGVYWIRLSQSGEQRLARGVVIR